MTMTPEVVAGFGLWTRRVQTEWQGILVQNCQHRKVKRKAG
jgi:hypothetical protein